VRDVISHSLEERRANGLQDASRCYIGSARWVAGTFDFECGAGKAGKAEDGEVYPAGLSFESVPEDNYERQEEERDVNANLGNGDCFFC
jgi:hypothetical protein